MTPPHIVEAIDTISAYLKDEGYATCVISETGGAGFQYESILERQNALYRVIDTLHVALMAADSSAASTRTILRNVRNLDEVFRVLTEHEKKKKAEAA